MIASIFMKSCATYTEEGAAIENCKKINFIYGPNGSGKSTISNYMSDTSASQFSACKINWTSPVSTDILVYNRGFRTRHFKENIAGVFTLGQATIEEKEELEKMKRNRERKQEDCISRSNSLKKKKEEEQKHKDDFKDTVWNVILKENEIDFQDAFSGFRNSKEKFRKIQR